MKTRKSYETSFKEETVKLAKEIGISKASQDLNVPENTLRACLKSIKNEPNEG